MRYHMILIETDLEGRVSLHDMTHMIYQNRIRGLLWNNRELVEIVGREHTVYIIDVYREYTHAQHISIAGAYIAGNYVTYNLSTGITSKGTPQ
jgi:hypothetical protein